jgi:hypothetical protein
MKLSRTLSRRIDLAVNATAAPAPEPSWENVANALLGGSVNHGPSSALFREPQLLPMAHQTRILSCTAILVGRPSLSTVVHGSDNHM